MLVQSVHLPPYILGVPFAGWRYKPHTYIYIRSHHVQPFKCNERHVETTLLFFFFFFLLQNVLIYMSTTDYIISLFPIFYYSRLWAESWFHSQRLETRYFIFLSTFFQPPPPPPRLYYSTMKRRKIYIEWDRNSWIRVWCKKKKGERGGVKCRPRLPRIAYLFKLFSPVFTITKWMRQWSADRRGVGGGLITKAGKCIRSNIRHFIIIICSRRVVFASTYNGFSFYNIISDYIREIRRKKIEF